MIFKDQSAPAALASPDQAGISTQIPSFAVIGMIGYFVDAAITYTGAKYLGLSPELARPPGFIVATTVNFLLNRAFTFRHSEAPFIRAFIRYSSVALMGLAIDYGVYSACVLLAPRFGSATTSATLPLFVAAGTGTAMVFTFLGFRLFAFRS